MANAKKQTPEANMVGPETPEEKVYPVDMTALSAQLVEMMQRTIQSYHKCAQSFAEAEAQITELYNARLDAIMRSAPAGGPIQQQ